jgi:phosphoglycerol transferase MdoB-like AlkP superfamily enzyme
MFGLDQVYNRYGLLLKRLLLITLVYFLFRVLFLVFNYQHFQSASAVDVLMTFIHGLRFDLSAIFYSNSLVILLHILPIRQFSNERYQRFLGWSTLVFNIPAIVFNIVDVAFFPFQGKRSTADLFNILMAGDTLKNTLGQMVSDFWHIPLLIIILTIILYKLTYSLRPSSWILGSWKQILIFILWIPITVVVIRGGLQVKPLRILSAGMHVAPQLTPVALNTSFTILRTLGKNTIEEFSYFTSDDELYRYFNAGKPAYDTGLKNFNVMVIIMESFSAEYVGHLNNGIGYTPVLDSLSKHSATFTNAFANSKRSIDALPAIASSLPALMSDSYITSLYSGNELSGIGGYLSEVGYETSFFHGGVNGTMGFDNFTSTTGFDNYFGRNECSECRFDGKWGIYDEDFFSFMTEKTDELRKPFMNCFFSISSHHPYNIPDEYTGVFIEGEHPILKSIAYADHALGKFFEDARRKDWFNNTLFVITADHTGPSLTDKYSNSAGKYRIPLLFFMPSEIEPVISDRVVQQCDILPGIFEIIGYDRTFTSFGNSVFDRTGNRFVVNFTGDIYQSLNDSILMQFNGEDITGIFRYRDDPMLRQDLIEQADEHEVLIQSTRSYLQQYSTSMINNRLVPQDD